MYCDATGLCLADFPSPLPLLLLSAEIVWNSLMAVFSKHVPSLIARPRS